MPQIMIDLATENDAEALRTVACMLWDKADALDPPADVPSGTVPVRPVAVEPIAPCPAPLIPTVADPTPVTVQIPPPPPAVVIPPPPPMDEIVVPVAEFVRDNVELDKRGFPHDARIHSSPPSIRKGDGQWRGRRGLDNVTLETVEAELRAKGYGVAVPAAPVIPPPPPVSDAPVTIPPPPPVIPPPPPPAGQSQGVPPGNQVKPLFAQLVDRVAALRKVPIAPEILSGAYAEIMGKPAALQDFHGAKDRIPALLERLAVFG
jgi:hypothetical protein